MYDRMRRGRGASRTAMKSTIVTVTVTVQVWSRRGDCSTPWRGYNWNYPEPLEALPTRRTMCPKNVKTNGTVCVYSMRNVTASIYGSGAIQRCGLSSCRKSRKLTLLRWHLWKRVWRRVGVWPTSEKRAIRWNQHHSYISLQGACIIFFGENRHASR